VVEGFTEETQRLAICCQVGDAACALDTEPVQEVVRVGAVAPVRGAPPHVVGIMNLRGSIVTIIDLRSRMGLGPAEMTDDARILIVAWAGEQVGLLIERETGTADYELADVKLAPENVRGTFGSMLSGVFSTGGKLVALLDVSAIVSVEEGIPGAR
jgi:purine-binding chemotaxis protein CheW